MPLFLVPRTLGEIAEADLDAAVEASTQVRLADFPEVEWQHTHVVRTTAGLTAYCIYRSPDAERIRAYSDAAGLPVDDIAEIERDLVP
jgi:hypothetical protein